MEERLKLIRKSAALTQTEMAERLGLKRNTIAGYETGFRVPSNPVITAICKEFNINEAWLRTGIEPLEKKKSADEIDRLAEKYRLGQNGRTLLRVFVRTISMIDEKDLTRITREEFNDSDKL